MHIENVHIHFGSAQGLTAAEFAKTLGFEAAAATKPVAAIPAIGAPWPGIDGIYAGITRGENGEPDAHLVLLNVRSPENIPWAEAVKWAEDLGDGARLPTRFESALLYANLQDQFDTDRWHWTGTQSSSYGPWFQDFSNGYQLTNDKKFEARARAVRLIRLD